jgi:stage II sporulation protein M
MASSDTVPYLYQLKYYMIIGLFIFIFFTMIGYFIAEYFQMNINGEFENTFQWIATLDPFSLTVFIFLNNSIKSFFAILLGFFFAMVPLLFVTVNGLLIGIVFFDAIVERGLTFILSAILPHGVIEIPIFLLSVAIGLRMGVQTVLKLDGRDIKLKSELKRGLKFFAFYILPFFLLSALIEAFITPFFISIVIQV